MQLRPPRWLVLMLLFFACSATTLRAWRASVTEFSDSGSLAWTDMPPDYVGFVQQIPTLGGTDVWNSAALAMTGATANVDCSSAARGFFRLAPCYATNVADYPLQTDAADASGHLGDMVLVNVPFTNGGIYCDGQYPDTSANVPVLTNLDFSGFLISAEFMVASNSQTRPVFVGGNLWRWAGFYVRSDGMVGLLANDLLSWGTTLPCSTNQWHQAVLCYTETNQTFEIYLDGRFADRRQTAIDPHDDRTLSVSHYGSGTTFNGHLRNLRIYNLQP